MYDASERLAAAVQVARDTLAKHEPSATISATEMNLVTMSLQIDVESATFSGPTDVMDAQDGIDEA